MPARLFNDDGTMTAEGGVVDGEATRDLRKYFSRGTPHEVAAALHIAVECVRCETILTSRSRPAEQDDGGIQEVAPR